MQKLRPTQCVWQLVKCCMQVSAVTAVGLAEGSSHINRTMLLSTLRWCLVGFALVLLCTSALVAQGHFLAQAHAALPRSAHGDCSSRLSQRHVMHMARCPGRLIDVFLKLHADEDIIVVARCLLACVAVSM